MTRGQGVQDAPARKARWLLASFGILLSIVPIFSVRTPPLGDYPPHLARIGILADMAPGSFNAGIYDFTTFLSPNVAMDVVMLVLAGFLPIEIAGQVFCALTLLLIFTGTLALRAVLFGRIGWLPLAGSVLLYN